MNMNRRYKFINNWGKRSCKFRNTHKKPPVLESLFNKDAGLRTLILKNICERVLSFFGKIMYRV